ncbi:MAG TPA: hypothetical protein VF796_15115, partial [Humisphaera sp.]
MTTQLGKSAGGGTRGACAVIESMEARRLLAAGAPDPTFGKGGFATVPGPAADAAVIDVRTQHGRTYVATARAGGPYGYTWVDLHIVRLTRTGKLDRSFRSDRPGNGVADLSVVAGVAVQPNGKVLVSGIDAANRPVVFRLNDDGSRDRTFAAAPLPLNGPTAPAVTPDGKVVVGGDVYVGGTYDSSRFAAVRLNADGSLDRSFGGNGLVTLPEADGWATRVAVQPDGGILLGGAWEDTDTDDGTRVVRIKPDGTADDAYGGFFTGARGDSDTLLGMEVDARGQLYVAVATWGGGYAQIQASRLSPDGHTELAYDGFSVSEYEFAGHNTPFGDPTIAISPDGDLLMFGAFTPGYEIDGLTPERIVRWDPDGTLNHGFGDGTGFSEFRGASIGTVRGDGRIVTAAVAAGGSLLVARRLNDDTPPPAGIRLLSSGTLSVDGTSGNDTIRLTVTGPTLTVESRGVVRTFATSKVKRAFIDAGDGDDRVTVVAPDTLDVRITGGKGNDRIDGGTYANGGDGDDYLVVRGTGFASGGNGADTVDQSFAEASVIRGQGEDVSVIGGYDGDFARDVLTFASRPTPLVLSVTNSDYVLESFDVVIGTAFDDTMQLVPESFDWFDYPVRFAGGPGNDTLIGGRGSDLLDGGPGRDRLIGGEGYDTLLARDGEADVVDGGPDDDVALVDPIDTVTGVER